MNPRPSRDELKTLYKQGYFEHELGLSSLRDDRSLLKRIDRQSWLIPEIKAIKGRGSLLDVGCAFGVFLKQAELADFDVTGIDVSAYAVEFARKRLGLNVIQGTLDSPQSEFPGRRFDIITMRHELEHEPDPCMTLKLVGENLKDDGLIVITVPNAAGLESLFFGKTWPGWRVPFHLYSFGPKSIKKVLSACDLSIDRIHFQESAVLRTLLNSLLHLRMPPKWWIHRDGVAWDECVQQRARSESAAVKHGVRKARFSTAKKKLHHWLNLFFHGRDMTVFATKSNKR